MKSKHSSLYPPKVVSQRSSPSLIHDPLHDVQSDTISPGLRTGILLLFFGLLAVKVLFAARMNLYGDEAFYFQCAQRLDIGYADHPFMTALLVRLGTMVAGDTTLGVRLMFLLTGLGIPLGVFWLARPLVGLRNAWLAMAASLLMPPLGLISAVAGPDAMVLACVALGLAAFERATRTGSTLWWLTAGLIAACGLSTHYRFILFLFGAFLYLAGTDQGRSCLKKPGPWIGSFVACMGFLPILAFNSRLNWAPLRFQMLTRHDGGFQFENLFMHPLEQLLTASPLLYVTLLIVFVIILRHARAGDHRSALLAIFSFSFLGTYFFLSPWSDSSHLHMHWPLPGYLPLFVLLPGTLQYFVRRKPTKLRKITALMGPGLGGALICLILLELGLGMFQIKFLHNAFAGWNTYGQETRTNLQNLENSLGTPVIVVCDNYITAGQSEFYLHDDTEVYSLNHRRNQDHGRDLQYVIWQSGEQGLHSQAGKNSLVVVEDSATRNRRREQWEKHIASFFESLEPLDKLTIPLVHKKPRCFHFYLGRHILPETPMQTGSHPDTQQNRQAKLCTLGSDQTNLN